MSINFSIHIAIKKKSTTSIVMNAQGWTVPKAIGAKILGVVLNRIDVHRGGYGYYYYGYGYYSGYSGYYATKDEEEESEFGENDMNSQT